MIGKQSNAQATQFISANIRDYIFDQREAGTKGTTKTRCRHKLGVEAIHGEVKECHGVRRGRGTWGPRRIWRHFCA